MAITLEYLKQDFSARKTLVPSIAAQNCWTPALRLTNLKPPIMFKIRGVGRGHWAMAPLDAEGALCDCSAPSSRECVYTENLVGGRPQAPSNDEMSLRKVPPMTTVWRPPWVKWHPPDPWPPWPLCDFLNTLLIKMGPSINNGIYSTAIPATQRVLQRMIMINQSRNERFQTFLAIQRVFFQICRLCKTKELLIVNWEVHGKIHRMALRFHQSLAFSFRDIKRPESHS